MEHPCRFREALIHAGYPILCSGQPDTHLVPVGRLRFQRKVSSEPLRRLPVLFDKIDLPFILAGTVDRNVSITRCCK